MSTIPTQLSFHGNGGSYPPHGVVSADDHGPYVVVATWILMCLMSLSVLARFGLKRSMEKEALAILVASVLAIGQSVAIHLAVNHGLGRHTKNLSAANYSAYAKAAYTSQILQIAVFCLAKLSLIFVFNRLTPSMPLRRLLGYFIAFVTLWAVASVIASAFQCHIPRPWDSMPNRCFNQATFFYVYSSINVLTDAIIIVIPIVIIWNVQIKRAEKCTIIAIFSTRILVCIVIVIELATLGAYFQSTDQSWLAVAPSIWEQAAMNLSIITACIPLIKPFLTMLQFSLIDSSIPFSAGMYQLGSKNHSQWTRKPERGAKL